MAIKWPEMVVKWPFQKVVSFLTEQTLGRSKHMANFDGKKIEICRFVKTCDELVTGLEMLKWLQQSCP